MAVRVKDTSDRIDAEDLKVLERDPVGIRIRMHNLDESERLREQEIDRATQRRFNRERLNRGNREDY